MTRQGQDQHPAAEPEPTREVAGGEGTTRQSPLSDDILFLVADGERPLNPGEATQVAAELAVLRDRCGEPGVLSFVERSLVREVCHDLINRAMREERDEIPCSTAAADLRAKEAAIRKLLGAKP